MAVARARFPALALAVTMLFVAAGQAVAERPSVAETFRRDVAAFANLAVVPQIWVSDESPWAPYLGAQFSQGLSDEDRARSIEAGRFGQCEIVLTLEQKGFVALYPDLESAFYFEDAVRTSFAEHVVPQVSFAHHRCAAWRDLIPIVERARRRNVLDETFTVDLPLPQVLEEAWYDPEQEKGRRYRAALQTFYSLAYCDHYGPAIADVVQVELELGVPRSTSDDLMRLRDIAEGVGVALKELDQLVDRTRSIESEFNRNRSYGDPAYFIAGQYPIERFLCGEQPS